jgi:cyanobactin maturation PatA/PatG family protease
MLKDSLRMDYPEKLAANGVTMDSQNGKGGKMNYQGSEYKNYEIHTTAHDELQENHSKQLRLHDAHRMEQAEIGPEVNAISSVAASEIPQVVNRLPVIPNQVDPAQKNPPLVFALGNLGYDFGTEARRDSIMQEVEGDDLLSYLDKNPSQAASIIWTLNLDATPIYSIQPRGAFASEVYAQLRKFLREQAEEGVERVSIPGVIIGQVRLMSGQVVPVIWPEPRCMYSWTTTALVDAVEGKPPNTDASSEDRSAYAQKAEAITDFLARAYHELRNLGVTSQDRAMNYAAVNLANAKNIFDSALRKKLTLHSIEVVTSPICRPGSDCWDVKLLFFDPENILRAKTVYLFTVDVSEACPVMVGPVRSWFVG